MVSSILIFGIIFGSYCVNDFSAIMLEIDHEVIVYLERRLWPLVILASPALIPWELVF
jgi:endonuclease V-like protein UPF0215 family